MRRLARRERRAGNLEAISKFFIFVPLIIRKMGRNHPRFPTSFLRPAAAEVCLGEMEGRRFEKCFPVGKRNTCLELRGLGTKRLPKTPWGDRTRWKDAVKVDATAAIRIHERMLRPLRTALPFVCLPLFLCAGCSTIYRPVYSPGKSNYKKPPEKLDSAAELLPPAPSGAAAGAGGAAGGLPPMPDAGAAPATPAPGMLDAPPAIPGLPQ